MLRVFLIATTCVAMPLAALTTYETSRVVSLQDAVGAVSAPDPQDGYQKVSAYDKAAASGDALAMMKLASLYAEGKEVPQDYKLAMAWLEKAAAAGNADAMMEIGDFYSYGLGVPKDDQA